MEPFRFLTAVACPLPLANIDTDQILPARFLRRPRAEGFASTLFRDMRFDANDRPRPGFRLDAPEYAGARILVARRNFGAGSSREAAVYALADHGIGCVIAPSFGDIFAANAVNNGVLPARVLEPDAERLLALIEGRPTTLTVDLEAQTIRAPGGESLAFAVDPVWRLKLLNGWNDLDLTRSYGEEIAAFARADASRRPWALPRPGVAGRAPREPRGPETLVP